MMVRDARCGAQRFSLRDIAGTGRRATIGAGDGSTGLMTASFVAANAGCKAAQACYPERDVSA